MDSLTGDLVQLEWLELVSKVSSELQNHLGLSDNTLAEYVIDKRKQADTFETFQQEFNDQGFPASLIRSLDRLVSSLGSIKNGTNGTNGTDGDFEHAQGKKQVFKGLAMPDSEIDGLMAELEAAAPKREQNGDAARPTTKRKRSPRDDRSYDRRDRRDKYRDTDDDRAYGKRRQNRHRSPDYDNSRSKRRYVDEPIPARMPRYVSPPVPDRTRTQKKRLTSPERFEIQQLIASGAAKASDFPEYEKDYQTSVVRGGMMENEEDVEVELKEDEPPFLQGQTKQSLDLSPIRVVKAPDGSLNRAAQQGVQLAQERRDLRAQEAREKAAEAMQNRDMSSAWNDPMARPEDRRFASDVRENATPQSNAASEWKRQNARRSIGKRTNMTIKEQRESLPAFKLRKSFLQAMDENQVLIVKGETGSGKTTQLPQYLAEAGYGNRGMIGCTQPRRVAAVSVAKRVSEEVGCKLGNEVGYTIRFEDVTSPDTTIKFMTDGILLRESVLDPRLEKYSVIMLDEAHERTIATDVLFGLLKKTLSLRPDLKIIVTSATLEAEKFMKYFSNFNAPYLEIPGRTCNVEIFYSNEPESDYLDAALTTVMQIHLTEDPGDMLLFLTGKEEIDTTCQILFERMKQLGPDVPELIILPIYSALPSEMQSQVFEPAPPGGRKVIVATNIAETSLTVDGIIYVIDPGFVKQSVYDPKLGMDRLLVQPISQQQAGQRAGRAGRTADGKCFRLYTEHAFLEEMQPATIPEIQRQNLASTILSLKARGINDLLNFGFLDPPPTPTMLSALEELYHLSALDDEGLLTRLGRAMVDFPMDPALGKTCIVSADFKCSDEILTIVSCISSGLEFFTRPRNEQSKADQKKAKFHDQSGDHMTLLNAYESWRRNGEGFAWCKDNFIQFRSMKRAKDVREQLLAIMQRHRLPIVHGGRDSTRIRKALVAGFFKNTARKDPHEGYKTLTEQQPVALHPSSALFGKSAEFVVYHSLVETVKEYMHCCSTLDPKWLPELAPNFFKVADPTKMSTRRQQERIQPLHNRFQGEDDWRLSSQRRQGRGGGGGTWG